MSRFEKVNITCPSCKKKYQFTKWDSINTKLNPELKDKVKSDQLFRAKCPFCDLNTTIDYGFLYHQMENQRMIWYANSDENEKSAYDELSSILQTMKMDNYLVRIVRSRKALQEKIMIFDDGLDDRIIELMKLDIPKILDVSNNEVSDISYFSDKTGKYIKFIIKGFSGHIDFPESIYKENRDLLSSNLPDIRDDGPFIDQQWALEMKGKRPPSNRNKKIVATTSQTSSGCLLPIMSILLFICSIIIAL